MAGSPSHPITHELESIHDLPSSMTLEASLQLEENVMTSSLASLDHPRFGTDGDWRGTGCIAGYLPSVRPAGDLVEGCGAGVSSDPSIVPAGRHSFEELDPDFDDINMDPSSSAAATLDLPSEKALGKRRGRIETSEPMLEGGFQHKRGREDDPGNIDDSQPVKRAKIAALDNKESLVLNWLHQSENSLSGAHDIPAADSDASDNDWSIFPVNVDCYDPPYDFGAMYRVPCFAPSLWPPSSPEEGTQEPGIPGPFGTMEGEGCSSDIPATALVPCSQTRFRLSPLNEEYGPSAYVIEPRLQQHSKPPSLWIRLALRSRKSMSDELRRDLLRKLAESAGFTAREMSGNGIDTSPQVSSITEAKDLSNLFDLEVAKALAALDNAPVGGSCDNDWYIFQDKYDDDYDF